MQESSLWMETSIGKRKKSLIEKARKPKTWKAKVFSGKNKRRSAAMKKPATKSKARCAPLRSSLWTMSADHSSSDSTYVPGNEGRR